MTTARQSIQAIINYTKDALPHSALSTVYLLAVGALEEYDREHDIITREQKANRTLIDQRDDRYGGA